jgi:signal transduction histidine kinase
MVIGLISGIMATAFLLNIFFAVSLKENIHYLYAVYIAALLYEIFTLEGFVEDYSSGDHYRFVDLLTHISPSVCSLLMTRIMQWFLNQKRSNSLVRLPLDIVNGILILNAVLYILNYFFYFPASVTNILQMMQAIFTGLQLLLVVLSAVEKTIQRYQLAWLYLAATLWLMVGLFEYVLGFLGVNDVGLIKKRHPNDLQIGLVVESVVVFMAIIYRYNLYKKEKERLLTEMADQQRNLIHRIVAAEEEERRIAADLHDDIGATLGTLALHISNTPANGSEGPDLEKYYRRGQELSHKAAGDIRAVAHNLLPKDFKAAGLFMTLESRITELNALTKIRFSLVTEGEEGRLNEVVSILVYRIINELLTNIVRHSVASEAVIQLLIEEHNVQIMAEDNGIGFDQSVREQGIGLKNIAGRIEFLKGTLRIDSNHQGTHTIIHLPL